MTYLKSQNPSFYRENIGTVSLVNNGAFFAGSSAYAPCFHSSTQSHAPFGISYMCAKIDGDTDGNLPRGFIGITPSISDSNTRIASSMTYRAVTTQSNSSTFVPSKGVVSAIAGVFDSGDVVFTSNSLFIHLICR